MNENERRQTTKGSLRSSPPFWSTSLTFYSGRYLDVEGPRHERARHGRRRHGRARAWGRSGADRRNPIGRVTLPDRLVTSQDFERKSALFSIAVSEVLIVNIWEHQVGLYQGANMGLLKTVFEVNLALFLAAKEKGKVGGT